MANFDFVHETVCSVCGRSGEPGDLGLVCHHNRLPEGKYCQGIMRVPVPWLGIPGGEQKEPARGEVVGEVIDWHASMRDDLEEASRMNDDLYANAGFYDHGTNFRQVHDVMARLINTTVWLVDENRDLRHRLSTVCDLLDRERAATLRLMNP